MKGVASKAAGVDDGSSQCGTSQSVRKTKAEISLTTALTSLDMRPCTKVVKKRSLCTVKRLAMLMRKVRDRETSRPRALEVKAEATYEAVKSFVRFEERSIVQLTDCKIR